MTSTTSDVDYEDVWRGGWNDTTRYGPACRHRRRIVAKLAFQVPHRTILDLGCGDGALLSELADKTDAQLTGSDVSAEAVGLAQRAVPSASFARVDLDGAWTLDDVYDVAIMSEVLEHIEHDTDALRKLAPHARHVVISVPGGPADKVDYQFGHYRNYAGDLLPRRLEEAGFDVVRFLRWGFPFYELMLFFSHFSSNQAEMAGGRFSPMKKALAYAGYYLFALNIRRGTQVFALARSRMVNETGPAALTGQP